MALTGVHLILIWILGLNLIQTKHLLIETVDKVETRAEVGTDYNHVDGHDQVFSNMYRT